MTTIDYNRRNLLLTTSKVGEVVPSYFEVDNNKLISFLEKYYDYLDSNQVDGFGDKIKRLIHARDARENTTDALDLIVEEIGNGIKASSFFQQPRLMVKLLGDFYRAKGSLNSAEGFFKGFFGVDAEIEYPKQNIFTLANSTDSDVTLGTVTGSRIGYEAQKFLTNNELYQTFSILIKCGISTADYENLYKRFVHPAGFFFAGEVLTVGEGLTATNGLGLDPLDSSDKEFVVSSEASTQVLSSQSLTALLDSSNTGIRTFNGIEIGPGPELRVIMDTNNTTRPTHNTLNEIGPSLKISTFNSFYRNIGEMYRIGSFTFDDSDVPLAGGYDGKVERSTYGGKTTSDYAVVGATHYADSNLGYLDSNAYVFGMPFGGGPNTGTNYSINGTFGNTNKTLNWGSVGQIANLGPKINNIPLEFDYTHGNFDSSAWVNPEHYVGADMSSAANISKNIPGGLLKGSWIAENYPSNIDSGVENFFYRVDSDAYYYYDSTPTHWGGAALPQGDLRPSISIAFVVSRLQSTRTTSRPDFSLNLEQMDQEQFTTYTSDSAY